MALIELFDVEYATSDDGGRIAYGVAGSGDRTMLSLSTGFMSFEATTESMVGQPWWRMMLRLGRVVTMDPRGIGRSDRMPEGYANDDRLSDICRVLDAVGVEQVDVAGLVVGGTLGLAFAAAHPRRVRSVVALQPEPACFLATPEFPLGVDPQRWDELVTAIRVGWGRGGFAAGAPETDPAVRQAAARAERLSATPAEVERLFRLHSQLDLRAELGAVIAPVLIVSCPSVPPWRPGVAEDLCARLPLARLVEVPEATSLRDLDQVERHVAEFFGASTSPPVTRALRVMLMTDVVASTERASEAGNQTWRYILDEHDRVTREQIELHDGSVIESTGDGVLAVLPTPTLAMHAASAITRGLRSLDVNIRAGIHLGEVDLRGDNIGGVAVHVTARVMHLAGPGETLISDAAYQAAFGTNVQAVSAGAHRLKGVPGEWQLWRLMEFGTRPVALPTQQSPSVPTGS